MDCKECDGLLVAYVKGELPEEDVKVVERHIHGCDACRWNTQAARNSLELIASVSEDDGPIAKLIDFIFAKASEERASDIHIDPGAATQSEGTYKYTASALGDAFLQPREGASDTPKVGVRFRIDGVLHDVMALPRYVHAPLATRLCIMAEMNPFELRLPQFGRIAAQVNGEPLDLRVATLPTWRGLRITCRIVRSAARPLELGALGLSEVNLSRVRDACYRPNGVFLVAGPVGAGKTTLLYSMLNELSNTRISVLTVENPAETELHGISQTHINTKLGLDYPAALKAIMCHDPDIVMCGDIPDTATAGALNHIALTGHLVLAPVTGVDAADGILRYLDICGDTLAPGSVLIGVAGIRLIRTVCPDCAEDVEPTATEAEFLRRAGVAEPPSALRQGRGCDECRQTGYHGRTGIHEVLIVDEELRGRLVSGDADAELIERELRPSLAEDAAQKVLAGVTTAAEAARVVSAAKTGVAP